MEVEQDRINDNQALIIALNLQKQDIDISGPEIDFLDYLKRLSKKEIKILVEIIKKDLDVNEDFILFILERLQKKKFVDTRSAEWVITEEGNELLKKCYEMIHDVDTAINNDTFFSKVAQFSRSITEK